jgi:hypothetical protein
MPEGSIDTTTLRRAWRRQARAAPVLFASAARGTVSAILATMKEADPNQPHGANPPDLSAMIAALNDEAPSVRLNAVYALSRNGSDQAIDVLSARLNVEGDSRVRLNLVDALGRIGSDRATNALIARLNVEDDRDVRDVVVFALGQLKGDLAADALLAKLNDEDLTGRYDELVYALARIGSDRVIGAALLALRDEELPTVRRRAAQVLGLIGSDKFTDALSARLNVEEDPEARNSVAEALRRIGNDRAQKALEAAEVKNRPQPVLRNTTEELHNTTEKLHNTTEEQPRVSEQHGLDIELRAVPSTIHGPATSPILRIFATYPTAGATLIAVLAAAAAVVILQPIMGNAAENPAAVTAIGAIGTIVGLLAYAGWNAATDAGVSDEETDERAVEEAATTRVTLSADDLRQLLIDSYRDGQHSSAETVRTPSSPLATAKSKSVTIAPL